MLIGTVLSVRSQSLVGEGWGVKMLFGVKIVAAIAPHNGEQNFGTILGMPDINVTIAHSVEDVLGKVPANVRTHAGSWMC